MELDLAPVWRNYRNRLALVVVVIVGLVLWLDGADSLVRDLLVTDALVNGAQAAWITLAAGAVVRYLAFPCPYCGEPFHRAAWDVNPVASRCLHCGFLKWRDPHAARALTRH